MEFDWKTWFMETWEANRRLTIKTAQALIDKDAIYTTPVEGMRSFHDMLMEILNMERAYILGLAHEQWEWKEVPKFDTIDETLAYGRQVREETRRDWGSIPLEKLITLRPEPFWGGPEDKPINWLQYALENEIHHRAQGYVYLRLLGQEPPAFYDRS